MTAASTTLSTQVESCCSPGASNGVEAIEEVCYEIVRWVQARPLEAGRVYLRLRAICDSLQGSPGSPEFLFRVVYGLSEAEVRLMQPLAEGMSNKQIGRKLWLSERTVRNHLANIFSRLQLSGRAELTALWGEAVMAARAANL